MPCGTPRAPSALCRSNQIRPCVPPAPRLTRILGWLFGLACQRPGHRQLPIGAPPLGRNCGPSIRMALIPGRANLDGPLWIHFMPNRRFGKCARHTSTIDIALGNMSATTRLTGEKLLEPERPRINASDYRPRIWFCWFGHFADASTSRVVRAPPVPRRLAALAFIR
jgi:hypothetical protein